MLTLEVVKAGSKKILGAAVSKIREGERMREGYIEGGGSRGSLGRFIMVIHKGYVGRRRRRTAIFCDRELKLGEKVGAGSGEEGDLWGLGVGNLQLEGVRCFIGFSERGGGRARAHTGGICTNLS